MGTVEPRSVITTLAGQPLMGTVEPRSVITTLAGDTLAGRTAPPGLGAGAGAGAGAEIDKAAGTNGRVTGKR
jgi:hypothetical protein